MRLADKVAVHQVHPVKIGADLTASAVSNVLLWRARPKAALADLDALAATRQGQYVLHHMPPSAQAVRLAGDAVMALGAHRHQLALLAGGAVIIAAGWSHPRWPRPRHARAPVL